MIRIYLLSVSKLREEDLYKAACGKLDASRLAKVREAKRTEDKILRVGAGLLLQYAVQESPVFDYRKENWISREVSLEEVLDGIREPIEFEFRYGLHGKPYFAPNGMGESGNLFFSLSHSGDYVLCAISDAEIGADIQRIPEAAEEKLKREENIAQRFFSKTEKEWYGQCGEEERRIRFYRVWSAKEAYMKLTGNGLAQGLDSFTVNLEKGIVTEENEEQERMAEIMQAKLYEADAPDGYTAAVSVCL